MERTEVAVAEHPGLTKRIWQPSHSTVERSPNHLQAAHEQPGIMPCPHWHAQFEVNFVIRGQLHYRMHNHLLALRAGDLALFWGGLPHQTTDTSVDADYVVVHLPLVNFFRLRLPEAVRDKIMHGVTMISTRTDAADTANFVRWSDYLRSDDKQRQEHAIEELLLRIERIVFEPYRLIGDDAAMVGCAAERGQQSFQTVSRMCSFIAENFRHDIDSLDIAASAGIHPKYAMNTFKKSTGMTLNDYVSLLRLSYAQALLINEDANVLHVAMESGFRSLSAFNASFRRISGMSPSSFRRHYNAHALNS
jgi:AraC-like DNA-binding protein/uncharacterized RmlC-like cupin family protein